jgi:DNA invertase Pin-like site-specific DNA recombinase
VQKAGLSAQRPRPPVAGRCAGPSLYQLSGAFAEFERDCIRERVRAGMRNARYRVRPGLTPEKPQQRITLFTQPTEPLSLSTGKTGWAS